MAVRPAAITKKRHRKKVPYCSGHTKRYYISHIAAFFSTAAIAPAQNDIFITAEFLKHRYISIISAKAGLLRQ